MITKLMIYFMILDAVTAYIEIFLGWSSTSTA